MTRDYETARREAQEKADRTRCYVRLKRDLFGSWNSLVVPNLDRQYGRDLEGELVRPQSPR